MQVRTAQVHLYVFFFNKYTENFFEIFDNLKKYFLFSSLHYCEKKYIAYMTQKVLTSYLYYW